MKLPKYEEFQPLGQNHNQKCVVVVSPSRFYLVAYVTTWGELAPALFLSLRRPPRASRAKNNSCFTSCSGAGPLHHHTLPVRLLGRTSFIHSAGDWMQEQQPFSWDFSLSVCLFCLQSNWFLSVFLFVFLSWTWFDLTLFMSVACVFSLLTPLLSSPLIIVLVHVIVITFSQFLMWKTEPSITVLVIRTDGKVVARKDRINLTQSLLLQLAFFVLEQTKSFTVSAKLWI